MLEIQFHLGSVWDLESKKYLGKKIDRKKEKKKENIDGDKKICLNLIN